MSGLTRLAIPWNLPGPDCRQAQMRKRQSGKFLRGPVGWEWLSAAGRLPGRALHVAVAIAFLDGFENTGTVKLRPRVCRELGLDRHASGRGLSQLENARLVKAEHRRGAAPVVTILTPKTEPEQKAA